MNQYEKALENYDKAIQLDPTFKTPYNNRGWVYEKLGYSEKAEADFQQAKLLDSEENMKSKKKNKFCFISNIL